MAERVEVRNKILFVATLAAFLTPFMGSALNLAIPTIGQDLEGNAIMLNWIVTSFLLVSAAFLLPFGRLADMRGRKIIFVSGVGVFGVASLLCGAANSMVLLLMARIVQGLGATMMFSTSLALVTAAFPPQDRGRVLGLNVAAVYVGLSIGPALGGFLTEHMGWRSIFFLVALLSILVTWASYKWLPNDRHRDENVEYDLLGAGLIAASLMAIIYGASTLHVFSVGPGLTILGIIGLVGFVWQEFRAPSPILDIKKLISNTTFVMSNLAALINFSATFSIIYLLSLYLQVIRGFSAQAAGFILLIQPVLMAIISPFAGRLSDRFEPRIVASLGMALTAAGLAILVTLDYNTSIWLIAGVLLLQGLGFALFASPNMNAVMSSVDRKYYGVASSTTGTMRLVGQALSMAIVSFIFAANLGDAKITSAIAPELLSSSKLAFTIFTVLCIVGVFASLSRGKVHTQEAPPSESQ